MKFAKTSVLALAISAALAGPVLAQGAASDAQLRGSAQGKGTMQGGGVSGSGDEEMAAQPAVPAQKGGVAAKTATRTGTKGTVGSGHATPPKAMTTEPGSKHQQ